MREIEPVHRMDNLPKGLHLRRSIQWLLIPSIVVITAGCKQEKKPPPLPPNIVLITIDTLRADHLGCYGYFRNTSPKMDELAGESILFERCIAPMASSLNVELESRNKNPLYSAGRMTEIQERLLAHRDGAYWDFYSRHSVELALD